MFPDCECKVKSLVCIHQIFDKKLSWKISKGVRKPHPEGALGQH